MLYVAISKADIRFPLEIDIADLAVLGIRINDLIIVMAFEPN